MVINDKISYLLHILNTFSFQNMEPLVSLMVKPSLTEEEVLECKKFIYRIVGMENNNEPLPVPGVGARGKGPKRYTFTSLHEWEHDAKD